MSASLALNWGRNQNVSGSTSTGCSHDIRSCNIFPATDLMLAGRLLHRIDDSHLQEKQLPLARCARALAVLWTTLCWLTAPCIVARCGVGASSEDSACRSIFDSPVKCLA